MTTETESSKSRIERIQEAHPWLSEGKTRALLVFAYKKAVADPVNAGEYDSLQIYLENYTDWLIRCDDKTLKNELARVSEWFSADYMEILNDD